MNIKKWQERMHEFHPYGEIEDFKQTEIDELRAENAALRKQLEIMLKELTTNLCLEEADTPIIGAIKGVLK